MLAAVILSGGESRRMGSPKALLPYQGKPFLQHLLDVTQHARIGVLRVVLGAHAEEIARSVRLDPGHVVVNERWEEGQLSSIQAAVRSLPADTEGMLLCLVDHPLVSKHLIETLVEVFQATRAPVVLPTYEGRRGHPVIFSAALFAELLSAPPSEGARAVVHAHEGEIVAVPTGEEGVILNLNDPETLKKLTAGPG
jgi:molybdenum cofactor cytidylyltransferase